MPTLFIPLPPPTCQTEPVPDPARRPEWNAIRSLLVCVCLLFQTLVISAPRRRKGVEFVKNQLVAIRIVEGPEGGSPFERVLGVQILQGARVELVPRRIPSRLVPVNAERQVPCAEIVADRGQMCDQCDVVSADREQQAIAI